MTALICGSLAYDNIMVFHDRFKNHILPDKVHMLNVSFLVPEMRREVGGCSGNIAYNMKLLGCEPLPMGTVGNDFSTYANWMDKHGINRKHVTAIDNLLTAQAFITTDLDDNQITAFHPGAMNSSHLNQVTDAEDVTIGIVAPDGRRGMLEHATGFAEEGIPFIFDPGQGIPMFDGEDFKHFFEQATWIVVNSYEWEMLQDRTGYPPEKVRDLVEALIITRGGEGAVIYTGNQQIEIPAAGVSALVDPTGCGDAHRAGLLYGLMNDMDWETTGRIASLVGAIKMEHHGTQNHTFEWDQFKDRFQESFGYEF